MDEAGVMEADPAARDGAAVRQRADGAQVGDGGATDAADHAAGVGQGAQGAGLGHVKGGAVLNAERPGVAQAGIGAADVVVPHDGDQVVADGDAGQAETGTIAAERHAGIVRPGAAGHQGSHRAALEIIVGGGPNQLHLPVGQAGAAADRQLAAANRHAQAAPRLDIAAGDVDGVGDRDAGAGIAHGKAVGGDVVIQQQVATGEDYVGVPGGDAALVGQVGAGQGADGAAGAPSDGEGGRQRSRSRIGWVEVVVDVAGDGAAVDQQVHLAAHENVQGGTALDQSGVGDGADFPAIEDTDAETGAGDGAGIGQAGDGSRIDQGEGRAAADRAAVIQKTDGAVVIEAHPVGGHQGSAVGQGVDGAVVAQGDVGPATDRPAVGQRVDGAAVGHVRPDGGDTPAVVEGADAAAVIDGEPGGHGGGDGAAVGQPGDVAAVIESVGLPQDCPAVVDRADGADGAIKV
ncbi:hypothetical protein AZA_47525 [Nitrospirillum viridazoti Y2]|nr:hypothetical protein AZA_47525 [Nitrospirillum amazonense Y2]